MSTRLTARRPLGYARLDPALPPLRHGEWRRSVAGDVRQPLKTARLRYPEAE